MHAFWSLGLRISCPPSGAGVNDRPVVLGSFRPSGVRVARCRVGVASKPLVMDAPLKGPSEKGERERVCVNTQPFLADMEEGLRNAVLQAIRPSGPAADHGADATAVVRAEMVPHRGVVFLDVAAGGRFMATHVVTLESVELPATARWSLEFDEDGWAAAVPDSDSDNVEAICLEELFVYGLFRTETNQMFIRAMRGSMEGQQVDMAAFMSKFITARWSLCVGCNDSSQTLTIWVLKWARTPDCRVMVSCRCLFQCLGLDQFSGEWWRWVAAGLPRWRKHMAAMGLQRHVLRSAGSEVALCK